MSQAPNATGQNAVRDADILRMRSEGLSLQEIASRVNVTRERVRQIVKRSGGLTAAEVSALRHAEWDRAEKARECQVRQDILCHLGSSVEEVAARLGFDAREVRRVVPKDMWRLMIRPTQTQPSPWADDLLLTALQVAATYEFPLTMSAYARLVAVGEVEGPSVAVFYRRFGSWRLACEAAGVEPGDNRRYTYQSTWTDTDALTFVLEYLTDSEHSGSFNGYATWRNSKRPEAPASSTLRNRFGSWSELKRAALQAAPRLDEIRNRRMP